MDLSLVFLEIDQRNTLDPKKIDCDGEAVPYELWYSRKCTAWLEKMEENPTQELQVAVHGAHIARFEKPRESYPMGKEGYYQWKKDLQIFHAQEVSIILRKHHFAESFVIRVDDLITKKRLMKDPEVKTLEDVLSLVFMEHQLRDFREKLSEEKVIKAIQMTWAKMSEKGRSFVLALPLMDRELELLQKSLS